MTLQPMVSVVIPAFNSKPYILETLESVKHQTFCDFEVIVVDDGSTDGQLKVIEEFCLADIRFRVVRLPNGGVSAARNHGFNTSCGSLIAFLDSDDVWLPNNLELKVTKILSGDFGMVHSDGEKMDAASNKLNGIMAGKEGWLLNDILRWQETQVPGPSSILVRRTVLNTIGLFDTKLSTSADHDFFLRVAAKFRIGRVPQVTWKYRIHGQNMHKNIRLMEHDILYLYRKATRNQLLSGWWFSRQCYSRMYLILAASWAGDGRRVDKGLYFLLRAILCHPDASLYLLRRVFQKTSA